MPPAQIATQVQQYFAATTFAWLHKTEVKGGFLNFFIAPEHMAALTLPAIISGEYFKDVKVATAQTIMVEFSQPNTHKIFHVGHTRQRLSRRCTRPHVALSRSSGHHRQLYRRRRRTHR